MVLYKTNLAMKDETKVAEVGNYTGPYHAYQRHSSCSQVSQPTAYMSTWTKMTCCQYSRKDAEGIHEALRHGATTLLDTRISDAHGRGRQRQEVITEQHGKLENLNNSLRDRAW